MVIRDPASQRGPADAARRPAEPVKERHGDLAEIKIFPPDDWLVAAEGRIERTLQRAPDEQVDFDIVAWFAMDEDQNAARRMTECWYG